MPKGVRIHEYGGPEVLRYEDVDVGEPGPGEVLIEHLAIGLNYADIHTRSGRYPLPYLPHIIGGEACGIIKKLGPGVSELLPGDRVAYSNGGHGLSRGSYCQERVLEAEHLIPLPDQVDNETAAAIITKGLTTHYLIHDSYKITAEDTILVHAAAGGVGMILCQWARTFGAYVIGVVGSKGKASFAKNYGCHEVIINGEEDVAGVARTLTGGEGVSVVFDAVGADSFEASLNALRPHGTLVTFGSASGPIPPFDIFRLNELGSLRITSGAFIWHMRNRQEILARAKDVMDIVLGGAVKIEINQRFNLAEAEKAHHHMETRNTTGISILIP